MGVVVVKSPSLAVVTENTFDKVGPVVKHEVEHGEVLGVHLVLGHVRV